MAFVCHYCGKSFTSAEKLRAHKAVHDETQLQCHICDKVFIKLCKYLLNFPHNYYYIATPTLVPKTIAVCR